MNQEQGSEDQLPAARTGPTGAERPRGEDVARDAVLQHRALSIDRLPLAYVRFDANHRVLDWNSAAEAMFGYTRDEIVGEVLIDRILPRPVGDWVSDILRRLHAGDMQAHSVNENRTKDGRVIVCELPGLHVSALRDVTAQRRAERTLRENHNLLTAVVEGIPQALFVKDRGGRYRLVNSLGSRLVGKGVAEVIGRDDAAVFDTETARRLVATDRRVMETGEAVTFEEVVPAPGATRTYLTTKAPFRGPDGEVRGVIGIARDITERKATEEELRRQKEVLQTIFDHIPVMIAFIEPDGRLRLVNREWEQITGWTLDATRDRDMVAEFYPDPDERRRAVEFIRRAIPGRWGDFPLRARDGRVLDTSWANVLLSDGTSIGIGLDVSDRKRAEAERERLYQKVAAGRAELEVLSRRLIEAQEAERGHIARELHDEIGQVLTTVNLTDRKSVV